MHAEYEIVEHKLWVHDSGKTVSVHGACPYAYGNEAEAKRWRVVNDGYTVYNPLTGQYGIGRPPCKTYVEAQALVARLGRPSRIAIGD